MQYYGLAPGTKASVRIILEKDVTSLRTKSKQPKRWDELGAVGRRCEELRSEVTGPKEEMMWNAYESISGGQRTVCVRKYQVEL